MSAPLSNICFQAQGNKDHADSIIDYLTLLSKARNNDPLNYSRFDYVAI